eukprot:685729-Prorocentrum_lima.AAC.1
MTSSLVGSEMCIRDSIIIFQASALVVASARLCHPRPWSGIAACATQTICLLYTSDAADDM